MTQPAAIGKNYIWLYFFESAVKSGFVLLIRNDYALHMVKYVARSKWFTGAVESACFVLALHYDLRRLYFLTYLLR